MEERQLYMRYQLQFFADDGDKTEEATPKKKEDTRKEGQVAQSNELTIGVTLLATFVCLQLFIGFLGQKFYDIFVYFIGLTPMYIRDGFNNVSATNLINQVWIQTLIACAPFLIIGAIVGFFATKMQFKWMITSKPLEPKLSKLNPINGFKRMFSMTALKNLLISVLKIVVVSYVAYTCIVEEIDLIFRAYDMSLGEGLVEMYDLILDMGYKVAAVLCVIGAADYMFQRWKMNKDIRMSKQEVKDEFKNSEGDPQVKSQQRARRQQASQRRMMQSVPQADVVITNPTHFAVALRYDSEVSEAPVVTAKGADFMAAKIKEIAKEHQVQIVENKPLARMLYYNVDVDKEIPPELYQMVAEVLAYVYSTRTNAS